MKAINLFFNNQTDFSTNYNFSIDYSKVSLAAAQRSNKKKQQVKIKIFFNIPQTFKSLKDEDEIWVERSFDRYGKPTESVSTEDRKKKASITRFINTIQYFYIPALKGPEVLKYILGEVGKRQLISDSDIRDLNSKINNNIKDLESILTTSTIENETKFELPVLVEDFWQKLNINTKYDEFSDLEEKVNPSKKGVKNSLKKELFQIPLQLRGDGIKSKFIPPLLQWIQKHDSNKHYIWGIDEPENSLEFKKAQELADLYFSEYGEGSQLLLTSHSLAFIFPEKNVKATIFRCIKGDFGDTKIQPLDNLFKEQNKYEFADEIGALEIQKEFYEKWHKKDEEIVELTNQLNNLKKPIIFLEGRLDEKYFLKTLEIFKLTDKYPANIKMIGYKDENGKDSFSGKDSLKLVEKFYKANPDFLNQIVVLFFDVDCKDKSIKKYGKLVVYRPEEVTYAKYKTGVEHLLNFSNDFNKEDYQEVCLNGDYIKTSPDKNKIYDYVEKLSLKEQKKCLFKIKEILDKINIDYLS